MTKRKAFDLDEAIYLEFKAIAKEEGMKVAKLVELMMQNYIDMHNEYPETTRD